MARVIINYKKRGVSLFKKVLFFPVCLALGIGAFSMTDDDGYLYVMKLTRVMKGFGDAIYLQSAAQPEDEDTESTETTGSTVATNGNGLNLLLIDNIKTEGYVKDLLVSCRKSFEGAYCDNAIHASMSHLLGAMVTEHGTYGNTVLPKYYFGWDAANNSPYYNVAVGGLTKEQMTFEGFGSNEYNKIKGTQYLQEIDAVQDGKMYYSAFAISQLETNYIAKVSGPTNAGRSKGDNRYFPDACVYEDSMYTKIQGTLHMSDEEMQTWSNDMPDSLAGIGGMTNNRGNNGVGSMIAGLGYNLSDINHPNSWFNYGAVPYDEKLEMATYAYNCMDTQYNKLLKKEGSLSLEGAKHARAAFISLILLVESGDWYITSDVIGAINGTNGYANIGANAVWAWNTLHPSEQISTASEVSAKLQPYVKDSVVDAIKEKTGTTVSTDELKAVYNINNGTYNRSTGGNTYIEADGKPSACWYGVAGYVYRVSKKTSAGYLKKYNNGADPYILQDYELSGLAYFGTTAIFGNQVYAQLLHYAGVDVDVTDPSTYMKGYKDKDEWIPPTSDLPADWLTDYGMDPNTLSENQKKVLNAAKNLCGIPYSQSLRDGFDLSKRPTYLDCSSFVWRAYADAGITQGLPKRTGENYSNYMLVMRRIKWSELQPGDVARKAGHTVIVIKVDSNGVLCASAHREYTLSDISYYPLSKFDTSESTDYNHGGASKMQLFRVTGMDTGKQSNSLLSLK